MKELLFITSNLNKLKEVRSLLGDKYRILSLADIDYNQEIPEPFDSIAENSKYKASYFFKEKRLPCIAEDSGLEVEALDSRPGALSARYAGDERSDLKNINKVLVELKNKENRKAKFISVFTYKDEKVEQSFLGEMQGLIIDNPRGNNGFGYDPIFVPLGYTMTNAEMSLDEKNAISHRKKALSMLIDFIEKL
jgi:XTP/dITP diphosphohydrolase